MEAENLNLDEISEARAKAIRETIQPINAKELQALAEKLFPYPDHPWLEKLSEFISQNAFGTFYHATTNDHIHIIYSYDKDKGMWFLPDQGMGPLQARGLKMMKEIVGGGAGA